MRVVVSLRLLNTSLCASYPIFLSNDVNLNPGPITDPCVFCKKGCWSNQRAIQCDECDSWYHAKCIDMTKREYKNLADPSLSWICMTCICPLSAYSFDRSKSIDNTDQTMNTCKTSFNGEPEIHVTRLQDRLFGT